jgi:anti-sigma factor RsiW
MTGHIIQLHGDSHADVELVLPWYVTGKLSPAELARVETHLNVCPECAANVRFERRLAAEIAALPVDAQQGWAQLRRQMELVPPKTSPVAAMEEWIGARRRRAARSLRASPPWLGWAIAAQVVLFAGFGALLAPSTHGARYHALGAAPVNPSGNVVVIFRPDTSESRLRQTLQASDARLVDGPTAADAYVLHVPPAERAAKLASLRKRAEIELAEPVDSDGPS